MTTRCRFFMRASSCRCGRAAKPSAWPRVEHLDRWTPRGLKIGKLFFVCGGDDGVDAAAHGEVSHHGHFARREQAYEIVEDAIRDRFVEVTLLTERPQVELQRLQLHTEAIRHV